MPEGIQIGELVSEEMRVNLDPAALTLRAQFYTDDPIAIAEVSSRGCLFGSLVITNEGPAKWLLIFDSSSAPDSSSKPKIRLPIKEGGFISIQGPVMMKQGFYISGSSTARFLDLKGGGDDFHIFGQLYT